MKNRVIGPNIIIQCSEEILGRMDEWNVKHHTESGLIEAVRRSSITIEQAEISILDFLNKLNIGYQVAPLAGNSIHTDRRFL